MNNINIITEDQFTDQVMEIKSEQDALEDDLTLALVSLRDFAANHTITPRLAKVFIDQITQLLFNISNENISSCSKSYQAEDLIQLQKNLSDSKEKIEF